MNPISDITFTVGQQYENALGVYTVLSISEPKITVRYDKANSPYVRVGQVATYDAKGQAESMERMRKEKEAPSKRRITKRLAKIPAMVSNGEVFTLGYIAKHGHISISVGPNSIDTFPDDFKLVTGRKVHEFKNKGYFEDASMNKYSYSMHVEFPAPDGDLLAHMVLPVCKLIRDNTMEINSNDYVWGLLKNGFLPARHYRVGNHNHVSHAMHCCGFSFNYCKT